MSREKIFDKEYATQFKEEMMYLKECGIPYTWVLKDENTGISTWKYKKTVELFSALSKFYETIYYK